MAATEHTGSASKHAWAATEHLGSASEHAWAATERLGSASEHAWAAAEHVGAAAELAWATAARVDVGTEHACTATRTFPTGTFRRVPAVCAEQLDASINRDFRRMIERWDRKESLPRGDYQVFRVREDHAISPVTGDEYTFFVVEANDWINVIPVTTDGRLVFVRQYRHGTEEITLEIPGGVVDDTEDPLGAASREMTEETGYEAEEIVYLGHVAPNPAIQNNRCHTYLAKNCRRTAEQDLDGPEEIDVVLVDPADVPRLVREGLVSHGLVVAAFYLFDHREE